MQGLTFANTQRLPSLTAIAVVWSYHILQTRVTYQIA